MTRVVLDIETVGLPFESFDETQQEYLLRYAETEEKREEIRTELLNLWAPTAQLVAVGLLNVDSSRGEVYYQAPHGEQWASDDHKIAFRSGSEAEILRACWETLRGFETRGSLQLITFNGRGFDGPFLLLRSAILGIRPTVNLLPNRYYTRLHVDLLDQLTFYGLIRKFNFDFYAKAFGIESPKRHGITGKDLNPLFAAGKYREIAEYCSWDIRATAELFRKWNQFLNFGSDAPPEEGS